MAYLAKTALRYPVGDLNIRRAKKNELDKVTEWREVAPGEVVDDVPECSVEWLLRAGAIEVAD